MLILADLHTHIYPGFELGRAVDLAWENFEANLRFSDRSSPVLNIIGLTERRDCNFYSDLESGKINLSGDRSVRCLEGCIEITRAAHTLLVFPGRQLNTVERVELLSLGSDQRISSGQPLIQTLQQITAAGAVPVVNWAPGKWWFGRGKLIRQLIESYQGDFLLGDTSLRPMGYPWPSLMSLGRKFNRQVVFGSDPLTDPSEQNNIGRYCSRYEAEFDLAKPSESYRKLLLEHSASPVGQRSSFLELIIRLGKYYLRGGNC